VRLVRSRLTSLSFGRTQQGLTLTCAKYIWMLEPCVAPSFELQAVGRVDRMGQKQEWVLPAFGSDPACH
jgi:hypothetical protein